MARQTCQLIQATRRATSTSKATSKATGKTTTTMIKRRKQVELIEANQCQAKVQYDWPGALFEVLD